jgi:hypothetical protein
LDPPRITQNGGAPAASAGDVDAASRNIPVSAKTIVKEAMERSGLVIVTPIGCASESVNLLHDGSRLCRRDLVVDASKAWVQKSICGNYFEAAAGVTMPSHDIGVPGWDLRSD